MRTPIFFRSNIFLGKDVQWTTEFTDGHSTEY